MDPWLLKHFVYMHANVCYVWNAKRHENAAWCVHGCSSLTRARSFSSDESNHKNRAKWKSTRGLRVSTWKSHSWSYIGASGPSLTNSIDWVSLFTSTPFSTDFLFSWDVFWPLIFDCTIQMSRVHVILVPFLLFPFAKTAECGLNCSKVSAPVMPH